MVQFEHPSKCPIRVCCFSPSSSILATAGDDETICLWDISSRSMIRSLSGHDSMVTTCAFTPDSHYLISGSTAGDLKLWDARFGHGKFLITISLAHDLGVLGTDFNSQYKSNCKHHFIAFLAFKLFEITQLITLLFGHFSYEWTSSKLLFSSFLWKQRFSQLMESECWT